MPTTPSWNGCGLSATKKNGTPSCGGKIRPAATLQSVRATQVAGIAPPLHMSAYKAPCGNSEKCSSPPIGVPNIEDVDISRGLLHCFHVSTRSCETPALCKGGGHGHLCVRSGDGARQTLAGWLLWRYICRKCLTTCTCGARHSLGSCQPDSCQPDTHSGRKYKNRFHSLVNIKRILYNRPRVTLLTPLGAYVYRPDQYRYKKCRRP